MYQKSPNGLNKHFDFLLLDLFAMLAALWLAFVFTYQELWSNTLFINYRRAAIIIALVHICIAAFGSSYKGILRRGYFQELTAVCRHTLAVTAGMLICMYFFKSGAWISRRVTVWMAVLSIALVYALRQIWKKVLPRHFNGNQRILLLVSDAKGAARLLDKFQNRMTDFTVKGIVLIKHTADENLPKKISGVPVVTDSGHMIDYLEHNAVDEILFSPPEELPMPDGLIEQCRMTGTTIHMEIPAAEEISGVRLVENLGGVTVLTSYIKLITRGEAFLKRSLDILGGLAGLLMTGLISIFLVPAIYLSDPGPIFFSQERVGRNGRIFRIYKFRSMYQNAEERKKELMDKNEMQGFMFKMDADPRVIGSGPDGTRHGLGHFIRATSLDEFPQFWNVLKGDMSLVGTRPPTLDEWQQYDLHHRARLATKPGITGMWQVSGRSDITDFEEVVKLDMEYIQNWSFKLDVKILLKTVGVVALRKGSK